MREFALRPMGDFLLVLGHINGPGHMTKMAGSAINNKNL